MVDKPTCRADTDAGIPPLSCDQVYLAPLAGYTDLPFRRTCRRYGLRHAFTPLIDAGSVVYNNPHNTQLLRRGAEEEWLGVQLLGSEAELLRQAAAEVGSGQFDRVDFNLGCPVRKITNRGAGAALGHNPDLAVALTQLLVAHSRVPVTAKMRVISHVDPTPTVALARRLEEAGIVALTIHGRHWARKYSGPVATAVLGAVAEAIDIPLIANGGVVDRASGRALLDATGAAGVMVARGAIGTPWIFRDLFGSGSIDPGHEELCEVLREHVEGMMALYGEAVALRNARKIILSYLKGRRYRRTLRAQVVSVSTRAEFIQLWETVRLEGPR